MTLILDSRTGAADVSTFFPAGDYFYAAKRTEEDDLPVREEDVEAVEEFANPT